MYIDHIAIWTTELERLKDFYVTYLSAKAVEKYRNPSRGFESYFLGFSNGARLELMSSPNVDFKLNDPVQSPRGYTHLAISCGNRKTVEELTERIRMDGYSMLQAPHLTGDGYYESVVLDPDGNQIELTV